MVGTLAYLNMGNREPLTAGLGVAIVIGGALLNVSIIPDISRN